MSLAPERKPPKYSLCAATQEITNSCHSQGLGGAGSKEHSIAQGWIWFDFGTSGGTGVGGAGIDDSGDRAKRDLIAAERHQRHAAGWKRKGIRDDSALMGVRCETGGKVGPAFEAQENKFRGDRETRGKTKNCVPL
jgi:hypothetical protein